MRRILIFDAFCLTQGTHCPNSINARELIIYLILNDLMNKSKKLRIIGCCQIYPPVDCRVIPKNGVLFYGQVLFLNFLSDFLLWFKY